MNIMIDGKWINLDNVARIQPTNDGSQLVIEFTSHPQESDALLFMDMTAPGVKSAWAWLQKAAIVFDETTDTELEPETIGYKVGDEIVYNDPLKGVTRATIATIDGNMCRTSGEDWVYITISDIIGLAPPESADHE